jgi:hypothetical protein
MVENQSPDDGSMPNIVPPMGKIEGAPNWQTAYPMILWNMMTYYGDRLLISNHHDSLVRYFDFLDSNYHRTGLKNFRTGYGDWGKIKCLMQCLFLENLFNCFSIRRLR